MGRVDFRLYLVCDRHQIGVKTLSQFTEAAAEGGVRAIQFREKDLSLAEQRHLLQQIMPVVRRHGMRLLVNERVDLCQAVDADGVHLTSTGLPVPVARALLAAGRLLSVSCHSVAEVKQAEANGADFAVLGPIYDTPSKRPFGPPLGLAVLRQARQAVSLPLFAIGGIRSEHLTDLFAAGADGVAVISEIAAASDVQARCREMLDQIDRIRSAGVSPARWAGAAGGTPAPQVVSCLTPGRVQTPDGTL